MNPEQLTLILIRGLPGAGKTSLAWKIRSGAMIAADDFFMKGDVYEFDHTRLKEAHAWCLKTTEFFLSRFQLKQAHGVRSPKPYTVVVHNTFTQRWEMEPYFRLAEEAGAQLVVISLFDGGLDDEQLTARTTHGVPQKTIAKMRSRYEHSSQPDYEATTEAMDGLSERIQGCRPAFIPGGSAAAPAADDALDRAHERFLNMVSEAEAVFAKRNAAATSRTVSPPPPPATAADDEFIF